MVVTVAERISTRLYMATCVAEYLAVLVHPDAGVHVTVDGTRATVGTDTETFERTNGETADVAVAVLIKALADRYHEQTVRKPKKQPKEVACRARQLNMLACRPTPHEIGRQTGWRG